MTPKIKVQTFFLFSLEIMFLYSSFRASWGNLGEVRAKTLKKCAQHEMKCSRFSFFLEVIFFGVFFGHVWGNLGKNRLHPQKFACSYTFVYICAHWVGCLLSLASNTAIAGNNQLSVVSNSSPPKQQSRMHSQIFYGKSISSHTMHPPS